MRFAEHTVVISRQEQTARRKAFMRQAEAIGLDGWEFFDAFDGERMQLRTLAGTCHGREGRAAPVPLLPTELGCLLSHLAIVRAAFAFGLHEVAILEDDVQFCEDFPKQWLAFLEDVPRDWLMIHAAGDHGGMSDEELPQPVNEHVSRVVRSYGTRFMILSRDAMGMLVMHEGGITCSEPADWLLPKLFDTERVYTPRKWLMRHR